MALTNYIVTAALPCYKCVLITHTIAAPAHLSVLLLYDMLHITVSEAHKVWEGFDTEAMWVELDALKASAEAARAAKAQKAKDEAAAAAAAAAEVAGKPAAEDTAAAAASDESVFASAGEIAQDIPDTGLPSPDQGPARLGGKIIKKDTLDGRAGGRGRALRQSYSLRHMGSLNRQNSLAAVGSGAVPAYDIHHLEAEADVEVLEPTQE